MARAYRVTFSGVAVSAAQDLVQITGAAGKYMKMLRAWCMCTDTSVATGQMLQTRARFMPATFTVGTGGTTGITPSRNDVGDAACSSATCATNNTGKGTTSGTAIVVYEGGFHLYQGENWRFDNSPPVGPSEALVYELLSTVSGTVHLSGGIEFEEYMG